MKRNVFLLVGGVLPLVGLLIYGCGGRGDNPLEPVWMVIRPLPEYQE